jgi:PAS domain S-box-containing protein
MPVPRGFGPAGEGERTAAYVYRVEDGAWWWSDEFCRLHGLAPGAEPGMDLLMNLVRPDDRERVGKLLLLCAEHGESFGSYHRAVDAEGRERRLTMTGEAERSAGGGVVAVRGFCVDVTEPVARDIREVSDRTIEAARASQAVVDQARGIVMASCGVDAEAAFALLRRHSQHTNTKLRDVARYLVEAAPAASGVPRAELRRRLEHVLGPRGRAAPGGRPG